MFPLYTYYNVVVITPSPLYLTAAAAIISREDATTRKCHTINTAAACVFI